MAGKVKLSPKDKVIVILGMTGAGRSTFINTATQKESRRINHGLLTCTEDVGYVRADHPETHHPVVFIDTPGFDATESSDISTLGKVVSCLKDMHKQRVQLAGILYFYPISANRLGNSTLSNLQVLADLCGEKVMPNVVVVTTMWGMVPDEIGERREKELRDEFCNTRLSGCKYSRFKQTFESAWTVADHILGIPVCSDLRIQEEIARGKLRLSQTRAGRLIKQRESDMSGLEPNDSKGLMSRVGKFFSRILGL